MLLPHRFLHIAKPISRALAGWVLPALLLLAVWPALAQAAPGTQSGTGETPILRQRPAQTAQPLAQARRLQIDVVVTDTAGKAVAGLQPWDFKILDNDHPDKIEYFRAFDGAQVKPDPPVEVILLLDFLNLPIDQQEFARGELKRFFAQSDGPLPEPVTLMVLGDKGLAVQPQPSRDRSALAALVDKVHPQISAFNAAMGLQGAIERFNRSVRQIRYIAENERHKPGRKILIWIGPGWPLLDARNTIQDDSNQKQSFRAIVELVNWLREAQMTVYSVPPLDSTAGAEGHTGILYQNFLKPVLGPKQAESGNLALGVLAAETGGDSLVPSNDIAGKIRQCIAGAESYYQLTFAAPLADRADEYHALKVDVNRAGVAVHTNTGYYDQPPTQ